MQIRARHGTHAGPFQLMKKNSRPMPVAPFIRSQPNIPLGIGYMVFAVSCFGMMDALVKWLTAGYPTLQIMFFRSLCAFPPIDRKIVVEGKRGSVRVNLGGRGNFKK